MDAANLRKPLILIVDDEPTNIKLLIQILKKEYAFRVATNGYDALERANIEPKPDLILLDIMMPEIDGYNICRKLKASRKTNRIPVIFITAKNQQEDERLGFEVGAVDFINKPISAPLLLARVKNHIELGKREKDYEEIIDKKTREIKKTQEIAILMLGEAGHYNDNDTGIHIWRMASYCEIIARALDWPVERAYKIKMAATLHDSGKIGIPDSILKAERSLTPEEWEVMKAHTTIGHSILSKSSTPLFQLAAEIALNHHERWDGSGYPRGVSGEDIPISARIVAISDVFDALTMRRPYKEAWSVEDATEEIRKGVGNHFDPDIAMAFLSSIKEILAIREKFFNIDEKDLFQLSEG